MSYPPPADTSVSLGGRYQCHTSHDELPPSLVAARYAPPKPVQLRPAPPLAQHFAPVVLRTAQEHAARFQDAVGDHGALRPSRAKGKAPLGASGKPKKTKATKTTKKAAGRGRPMTSSERGIKFRQKQQERQLMLLSSTETLRREIARLEALRDLRESSALVTSFTEGGAPMKLAFEYFAMFRSGVPLPGGGSLDDALVLKQSMFLTEMLDPAMNFCGKAAIPELMAQWRLKVAAHASIRVERTSSQLVPTDNCATVMSEGLMHLRFARKTIEKMYPHALAHEELVQKLVGRMLHMPFRSKMFFNEHGKLERLEVEPDLFTALYGVLRDLRECELLLGKSRMPKLITNDTTTLASVVEVVDSSPTTLAEALMPAPDTDVRAAAVVTAIPSRATVTTTNSASTAPMDLEFILS